MKMVAVEIEMSEVCVTRLEGKKGRNPTNPC